MQRYEEKTGEEKGLWFVVICWFKVPLNNFKFQILSKLLFFSKFAFTYRSKMKKIDTGILRMYSILLAGLLFIVGIATSCDTKKYGSPIAEYGAPFAKFKIKGNVKSDSTNENIANIKVLTAKDSTFSDSTGNYQLEVESYPAGQTFVVHFVDIDGSLNGAFHTKDTVATFTDPQYIDGDGNLYEGETSTQLNVKLKPE